MEKIGKYAIQGELGKGAMGIVYKAEDPFIGRPVAIKTIRFDTLTKETDREHAQKRFMREARSAGNLSHPNIVTIYEVGEDEGLTYIAMEFIEGESLEELLCGGKEFSIDDVIGLTASLGEALDYAHKKGIIHRDIKPGNILIDREGKPYIVDFGIARISTSTMTQTSMVMGTPYYMAPEQLAGKKIDNRADVFAMGAVVYEMITGEKPFPGETITTVIYKIVNEDPPLVRDVREGLPHGLDYILRKALAKNPDERYAACKNITEDLKNYPKFTDAPLPGKPSPSTQEVQAVQEEETQHIVYTQKKTTRPKSHLQKDRKPLLFVLGAMMAVVIIVLGTIFFLQKKNAKPGGSGPGLPPDPVILTQTPPSGEKPTAEVKEIPVPLSDEAQITALRREADALYLDGDLDMAAQKNNDILRLDADNYEAQLYLAEILRRKGQVEEARKEFERLLTTSSNDARIYLILGDIFEEKGDDTLALENYQHAFQIGFAEGDARNEFASRKIDEIQARMTAISEEKTLDETPVRSREEKILPEIKSDLTSELEGKYSEGESAFNRGDYEQAAARMEEVLELDPGNADAQSILDQAKNKLEETQEIQRIIDAAQQALNKNSPRQAMRMARDVLNRKPGNTEAQRIYDLAFEGATKKDILSLLASYERIYDPAAFHDFYKENCVFNEYSKWKDFFRSIPNLYDSVSTNIITPTVYSLKKERDRYLSAGIKFSQITTAIHKAKGTKQVLMDGTYFWELKSIENKWKITHIVYKPSR